eukprot:1194835-Prorocentrum_minimum.AAC.3
MYCLAESHSAARYHTQTTISDAQPSHYHIFGHIVRKTTPITHHSSIASTMAVAPKNCRLAHDVNARAQLPCATPPPADLRTALVDQDDDLAARDGHCRDERGQLLRVDHRRGFAAKGRADNREVVHDEAVCGGPKAELLEGGPAQPPALRRVLIPAAPEMERYQYSSITSPGVDGQKGLRLQFNRLSTLAYHSAHSISNIPSNIRRIFPVDRLPLAGRQSTPGLAPLR